MRPPFALTTMASLGDCRNGGGRECLAYLHIPFTHEEDSHGRSQPPQWSSLVDRFSQSPPHRERLGGHSSEHPGWPRHSLARSVHLSGVPLQAPLPVLQWHPGWSRHILCSEARHREAESTQRLDSHMHSASWHAGSLLINVQNDGSDAHTPELQPSAAAQASACNSAHGVAPPTQLGKMMESSRPMSHTPVSATPRSVRP